MDLIVTLDDATSEIYSAFLLKESGIASTFWALMGVFGAHGLPLALYTVCGSHYFRTPKAGGRVDRENPTQVGRALAHLGVEHKAAGSPEARDRLQRANQTLLDRLMKEMRLRIICSMEVTNGFLPTFIETHNKKFAVSPRDLASAHRPWIDTPEAPDDLLARREERVLSITAFGHYPIPDPAEDKKTIDVCLNAVRHSPPGPTALSGRG